MTDAADCRRRIVGGPSANPASAVPPMRAFCGADIIAVIATRCKRASALALRSTTRSPQPQMHRRASPPLPTPPPGGHTCGSSVSPRPSLSRTPAQMSNPTNMVILATSEASETRVAVWSHTPLSRQSLRLSSPSTQCHWYLHNVAITLPRDEPNASNGPFLEGFRSVRLVTRSDDGYISAAFVTCVDTNDTSCLRRTFLSHVQHRPSKNFPRNP